MGPDGRWTLEWIRGIRSHHKTLEWIRAADTADEAMPIICPEESP